ncbi:MAG: hypothetical protein HC800_22245 [Phormidesmis sp. RL_2_1]|nr:hypothetical protein [Phormidesmis sp. RL_2_1]
MNGVSDEWCDGFHEYFKRVAIAPQSITTIDAIDTVDGKAAHHRLYW